MNIFVLDSDPKLAAIYNCDKHVVKMTVELFQLLGCAVIANGVKPEEMPITQAGTPLRGGYHNHPCAIWCGQTRQNFKWAARHAIALSKEYTRRYKKQHACEVGIRHLADMYTVIPSGKLTNFTQAMPEEYKQQDAVKAYRNYYLYDKVRIASWKKLNNTPEWFRYE